MKFTQFGNPNGKTIVYFHGVPVSPEEGTIFEEHAKANGLNIICPVRFSIEPHLQGRDYYQYLASTIDEKTKQEAVDFIGFSIGAHTAIETSAFLKSDIRSMHLVSAAAPLDGGMFLDAMAGGKVFKAALESPSVFNVLVYFQRMLAIFSPSLLTRMLFSSSAGKDKVLSGNTEFISYITPILGNCFRSYSSGYSRDILEYVKPWGNRLLECKVSTTLWHGTSDNWSPFSMAIYLDRELRHSKGIEKMEGLSHYSCLQKAAPQICAQLNPL